MKNKLMSWIPTGLQYSGILAATIFATTIMGFGLIQPAYHPWIHPVDILGAAGIRYAFAFNYLTFVLPGALTVVIAAFLYRVAAKQAAWQLRIGLRLILLSGLAFMAIGLLPLKGIYLQGGEFVFDHKQILGKANQYHTVAWMVWNLAFIAGGILAGLALRKLSKWKHLSYLSLVTAIAIFLLNFVLMGILPMGLIQYLCVGLWLLWFIYTAWQASRVLR